MKSFSVAVSGAELRFSAAHFIYNAVFKEHLHGHNYELEVEVFGELGEDGFVVNFLDLKESVRKLIKGLDHKVMLPILNPQIHISKEVNGGRVRVVCSGGEEYVFPEVAVALLPLRDTSSEELAKHLASTLFEALKVQRRNVDALHVKLYETPSYSASAYIEASSGGR